jgi:hypothetical protein
MDGAYIFLDEVAPKAARDADEVLLERTCARAFFVLRSPPLS